MTKPTSIRQGANLELTYDLGGKPIKGHTCDVYIKQHAKDTAFLTKLDIDVDPENPRQWSANIKPSDSATLAGGLWYAFANIIKSSPLNEEARQVVSRSIRFQVAGAVDPFLPESFILITGTTDQILISNTTDTILITQN